MGRVDYRRAQVEDVRALFPYLRKEDLQEIAAAGMTSYGALLEGFEAPGAEVYTVTYRATGEVMAMFGAAPHSLAGDEAVIWLLGTRRIDECAFEYLRTGRRYLKYILSRYRKVYNYVDGRSGKSVRFLKLLGFKFIPERNMPVRETVFLYFEKEAA